MVNEQRTGETASAKVEKVKGTIKEVAGEVMGNPALAVEGHAQRMAAVEQEREPVQREQIDSEADEPVRRTE